MGGWGSGRTNGRQLVEHGLALDLRMLMRRGWVKDGTVGDSRLPISTGQGRCVVIGLHYDLVDPHKAFLWLKYTSASSTNDPVKVYQLIPLTFTEPNFGGRRWWMVCPYEGRRVAKLHMPPGGDRFASREEGQLVYQSQRQGERGRAFERLFRLQRKLGCDERWGAEPERPKGMWSSTFEAYLKEYCVLDARCGELTDLMVAQMKKAHGL
jgi:hypothetical protein